MSKHSYRIVRDHLDSTMIIVDDVEIPLSNRFLSQCSFAIPSEILLLTGSQFEYYKQLKQELTSIISALEMLNWNYANTGYEKISFPHADIDLLELLQNEGLLFEEESLALHKYKTKVRKSTINTNTRQKQISTYIYLMRDHSTQYIKIGRSNRPKVRESTLFAEKPSIELLSAWKGHTYEEKELHDMFVTKRIRGEWFNLTIEDISFIQQKFADREVFQNV